MVSFAITCWLRGGFLKLWVSSKYNRLGIFHFFVLMCYSMFFFKGLISGIRIAC